MIFFSKLMQLLTLLTAISYMLNIIKLYDLSINDDRKKYINKKLCVYWCLTAIFGFIAIKML